MDAAEDEKDVQLQRQSAELLADLENSIRPFLWRVVRGEQCDGIRRKVRIRDTERLVNLLEPFQEQPQLLDPHLKTLIPILSDAFLAYLNATPLPSTITKDSEARMKLLIPVSRAICKILYTFCKIRGEKVIVRFFSTETRHLELLLSAIEIGDQTSTGNGLQTTSHNDMDRASAQINFNAWDWEERYITLLWLSQLLLAPFDLASISSEGSRDMRPPEIANLVWPANVPALTFRVVPLAIRYLSSSSKESTSAKLLLVRVAMRTDMQELGIFHALLQWALTSLNSFSLASPSSTYHYISLLSFVGGLLVSCVGTSNMKSYLLRISLMMEKILAIENTTNYLYAIKQSPVARKAIVKIIRQAAVLALQDLEVAESEDIVQNSIGNLLDMLPDTATHVRLAVSKALSVIAVKLDPDQASQVVDEILASLEKNALSLSSSVYKTEDLSRVDQNEWHGLIMTLSHLLYRHSIPAEGLPQIIEALRRGLSFEQRSSTGVSVGTNVRDAANFGIWSLARRYSTAELQGVAAQSSDLHWDKLDTGKVTVLQSLASELVVSASLDPAGNVRRGSSAALQELIGRHPNVVENGIAVVQVVDYHAVALRSRAIREVAPKAAILSTHYRSALMTGLMGWRGVKDTDAAARRNTAFAVGNILWGHDPFTNLSHNFNLIKSCLDVLAPREVETRHGLLLCLAEILGLIFPDCPNCLEIGQICLGHTSIRALDGVPSILFSNLKQSITNLFEELQTKSSDRRPELLAEAASRLIIKGLPLFIYDTLPALVQCNTPFDIYSVPIPFTLDHLGLLWKPPNHFPYVKVFARAEDLVSQFLKKDHPDSIDAVSTAASTLLLYISPTRRQTLAQEWIARAASSETIGGGAAYIHTLFKLLGTHMDMPTFAAGNLIETFVIRWSARKPPDLNIRETILDCIAASKVGKYDQIKLIPLICKGLNDYTTNARGDVGSKLRAAACKAAGPFILIPDEGTALPPENELLLGMVLRAAAEKLDKVRGEGQKALVFAMLRQLDATAKTRTGLAEKWKTISETSMTETNTLALLSCSGKAWFQALLSFQFIRWRSADVSHRNSCNVDLMAGYVTSAGTGSEDVVRASRAALVEFCSHKSVDSDPISNLDLVCSALMELLSQKVEAVDDRVLVPNLEVLAFLMDMRLLQTAAVDFKILHDLIRRTQLNSKNIRKLEACIKLYGGLIEVYPPAIKSLGAMLSHRFPKMRTAAVEELWVRLDRLDQTSEMDKVSGQGRPSGREGLKGFDWVKAGKNEAKERWEGILSSTNACVDGV